MAANTSLPPRFDLVDPQRNWYFVSGGDVVDDATQRFIAYATPYDVVYYMQMRLGDIAADGNWGTGTSDRLLAFLRETNAPASFISAVQSVKESRSLAGSNGLIAWTIAVYLSSLPRSESPDWAALQRGAVALGTNATVSQVQLPTYGRPAPGGLSRTATQRAPREAAPPATPPSATLPQGTAPADAAGASGELAKKMSWKTIAVFVVILLALSAIAVMYMEQSSSGAKGMSKEEARRLLGVSSQATQSEIREAWRRRTFAAAPGKDGTTMSRDFARLNIAYEVLTGSSAPANAPANRQLASSARANPSHLRR